MVHGIVKITLGGEERIVEFNNYFFVEAAQVLNCDPIKIVEAVKEIAMKKPMRAIAIITYAGIIAHLEAKANYTHGIELATVTGWMAECNDNDFATVWEMFVQATGIGEVLAKQTANVKEEDVKKKTSLGKKFSSTQLATSA